MEHSKVNYPYHPDLLKVMRYGKDNCPLCGRTLSRSNFAVLTCEHCPGEVEIYSDADSGICDFIDFYFEVNDVQMIVNSDATIEKVSFNPERNSLWLPLKKLDFNNLKYLADKLKLYLLFS
jgi:hypothetical protein